MRFLILIAASLACTRAQSGAAFEAASIKLARPDARGYSIRPLTGRLSAQNVTLKLLIAEAWHVHDFQVSGGPKWIDADRYDVEAKAGGASPPSRTQLRGMLQELLAERFGLSVRQETKQLPVYVLEAANRAKLPPAKHPEMPVMFRVFQRRQITAENAPLDDLTETLTWLLGRPVLDHTGLEGSFDYKLEWSPDEMQTQSLEAPPQTDRDAPTLAAALGQIGLKLVSQKSPVELIVVQKVEKPSPN